MVHLPQFETYLRSGVRLDDHDLPQAGLHREGHDDQDPQGQGTPAQRPLPSTGGDDHVEVLIVTLSPTVMLLRCVKLSRAPSIEYSAPRPDSSLPP